MVIRRALRRGFTLIELLVVILIISVLAGLILTGITAARDSVRRAKTGTILGAVRLGIETFAAERGGLPSGSVHPAANTAGTRLAFTRSVAGPGFAVGTPVATTGEALRASSSAAVTAAAIPRMILDSDQFSDPVLPHLVGASRRTLNILGSAAGLVRVRNLPAANPQNDRSPADGILDFLSDPYYDHRNFNDARFLEQSGTDLALIDAESGNAIRAFLGQGVCSEIEQAGGLLSSGTGAELLGGRFRSPPEVDLRPAPPTLSDGTPYMLRGLALYDGWGREILYEPGADGRSYLLLSAGRDGSFAQAGFDGATFDNITDGRRQE
ncbi:MAG: hypothetical protein RLZZ127_251 [Planctomycetota bacterium]|jgi:prepilin-type N-terminal cleavage/methylation domain-containing protein